MFGVLLKNFSNKELLFVFAATLITTYVFFVIFRLSWRLIMAIKGKGKGQPVSLKDCFKIRSWRNLLKFGLLFFIVLAGVFYFLIEIFHSGEIVLKTDPPTIAIVEWQFIRHDVGVEKIEANQVTLNIDGENYTFPAVEEQQKFMASVKGNELTIFLGIESSVTYCLRRFSQQEVVLSVSECEAPLLVRYLNLLFGPRVRYLERRYTDNQLMGKAIQIAKSDADKAFTLCSELSQKYIPHPSYIPAPFRCFSAVAYELVEVNYDKAIMACRNIENDFYCSSCLTEIVYKLIWLPVSLSKIEELNSSGKLCQLVTDGSRRSLCESGLQERLEAEECFNYTGDLSQAECFWEIAQKVRQVEGTKVCHYISNLNLAMLCDAGLERRREGAQEVMSILFRKWKDKEGESIDRGVMREEIDKQIIMIVISSELGKLIKDIETDNFDIYGRDAYIDIYPISPDGKSCIGTHYRLYLLDKWEIRSKNQINRCD